MTGAPVDISLYRPRVPSVAALVAVLFAVFTLIAAAPHNHVVRGAAPCGESAAGCIATPVVPPCSLCEWLTLPSLAPQVPAIALFFAVCVAAAFVPRLFVLCPGPAPRIRPRGPPVPNSYAAVA